MTTMSDQQVSTLREAIAKHEVALAHLRSELERIVIQEEHGNGSRDTASFTEPRGISSLSMSPGVKSDLTTKSSDLPVPSRFSTKWPLTQAEYRRYGRQLIIPELGLSGQLNLKSSAVLIVGAGGLGCPAAAYIVGAGVGELGLCDGDIVEESNLHRQILHSSRKVGMNKAESAVEALKA